MKRIQIPRRSYSEINNQGAIKLTPEAVTALMEVSRETSLSIRNIASMIIVQAVENDLIDYTSTAAEEE